MFFVLNSGRSGSRTIAQVLSQAPDCQCQHEPEPRLIAEAPRYRYGELAREELASRLRDTRPEAVEGRVYGETNNKLALLVPPLLDAFPEARFVRLVRDGRAAVASALQRGWFADDEIDKPSNDWHRWRLRGDRVGAVSRDEWGNWDQFEKVTWLWAYTNRLMRDDLEELVPAERRYTVQIEHLGGSLSPLCDLLGITPTRFVIGRANARESADDVDDTKEAFERVNVVDHLTTWEDWNDQRRSTFERHAGDLMDELYPDWRRDGQWRPIEAEVGRRGAVVIDIANQGEPTRTERSIDEIRADIAELRMLRGELRMALGEHQRVVRERDRLEARLSKQIERESERYRAEQADHERTKASLRLMRRQHRRVAERVTATEDVRVELAELDAKLAEMTKVVELKERIGGLVERISSRDRDIESLRSENQRLETEVRDLGSSQSYRVGHALVRLFKSPVLVLRWLAQRLRRGPSSAAAPRNGLAATQKRAHPETERPRADGRTAEDAPASGVFGEVDLALIVGLDPDRLEPLLATLGARDRLRPVVVVTDDDRTTLLRRMGVRFELLPHQGDAEPWSGLWVDRVAELIDIYRPATVLVAGPGAADLTAGHDVVRLEG